MFLNSTELQRSGEEVLFFSRKSYELLNNWNYGGFFSNFHWTIYEWNECIFISTRDARDDEKKSLCFSSLSVRHELGVDFLSGKQSNAMDF